MIHNVTYREERYDTALHCIEGIRELVALGWNVIQLRGASHGPFLVICRKDDLS